MIHDFSFRRHPDWNPRDRIEILEKHFIPGARRPDAIVAAFQSIKLEAAATLGIDEGWIVIVPEGVDRHLFKAYPRDGLDEFRRMQRLPERFVLSVGTLEPRKDLTRFLAAYEALPLRRMHPLVLASFRGWNTNRPRHALQRTEGVRYLGYVSDADLDYPYNLATPFVYPSLCEGFGLRPLEAMACGTPVAASRAGSLSEVLEAAVAYFLPDNVDEIADTLKQQLVNGAERERLSRLGRPRTVKFKWADTAAALLLQIFHDDRAGTAADGTKL